MYTEVIYDMLPAPNESDFPRICCVNFSGMGRRKFVLGRVRKNAEKLSSSQKRESLDVLGKRKWYVLCGIM